MVAICCRYSNQLAQHHSNPLVACFASVSVEQAVSKSPKNMLETQIPRCYYRCIESETLEVGLSCPCFNNPSRASATLRHSKIWEPLQYPSATQSFICVSLSNIWEFMRNVESWAPTQTDWIRFCIFTKYPDYSYEVGEAVICVYDSLLAARCNCLWCVLLKNIWSPRGFKSTHYEV